MRSRLMRNAGEAAVVAVSLAAALWPVLSVSSGDRSAFFGHVGLFKVADKSQNYSVLATLQAYNKDHCCLLCAVSDACIGVSYRGSSRRCSLLRQARWELEPDSSYVLLVCGAALSKQEQRDYGSFSGALNDSIQLVNGGSYTLAIADNATQCQYFCQLLACHAYQFHSGLRRCKVFIGDYSGSYLTRDSTDAAWSLSLVLRTDGRPFRKLSGAFPVPYGFTSFNESGVVDSLGCRQRCESISTNCSLFAYNSDQSLCYFFSGDVPPKAISFDFASTNWTAFYRFRDGAAARECSTTYYFVTRKLVRDDAERYCLSTYGAQLVRIDSADEQLFITRIINSTAGQPKLQ